MFSFWTRHFFGEWAVVNARTLFGRDEGPLAILALLSQTELRGHAYITVDHTADFFHAVIWQAALLQDHDVSIDARAELLCGSFLHRRNFWTVAGQSEAAYEWRSRFHCFHGLGHAAFYAKAVPSPRLLDRPLRPFSSRFDLAKIRQACASCNSFSASDSLDCLHGVYHSYFQLSTAKTFAHCRSLPFPFVCFQEQLFYGPYSLIDPTHTFGATASLRFVPHTAGFCVGMQRLFLQCYTGAAWGACISAVSNHLFSPTTLGVHNTHTCEHVFDTGALDNLHCLMGSSESPYRLAASRVCARNFTQQPELHCLDEDRHRESIASYLLRL